MHSKSNFFWTKENLPLNNYQVYALNTMMIFRDKVMNVFE